MVSQWSFHGRMKDIIYLFLRISAIGVADRQTVLRRPSIIRPSVVLVGLRLTDRPCWICWAAGAGAFRGGVGSLGTQLLTTT